MSGARKVVSVFGWTALCLVSGVSGGVGRLLLGVGHCLGGEPWSSAREMVSRRARSSVVSGPSTSVRT